MATVGFEAIGHIIFTAGVTTTTVQSLFLQALHCGGCLVALGGRISAARFIPNWSTRGHRAVDTCCPIPLFQVPSVQGGRRRTRSEGVEAYPPEVVPPRPSSVGLVCIQKCRSLILSLGVTDISPTSVCLVWACCDMRLWNRQAGLNV